VKVKEFAKVRNSLKQKTPMKGTTCENCF